MKTRKILGEKAVANANVLIAKLKKETADEFTTCRLLMYLAYCTSRKCNCIGLSGQKEAEEEQSIAVARLS